jgi:hypothetical protein
MHTATIDRQVLREIRLFNQNVDWLKKQQGKQGEKWGTWEEAAKILPRSRQWFKMARLGEIAHGEYKIAPKLEREKDWKMMGREVIYRLAAIEALRNRMQNRTVSTIPGSASTGGT